MDFPSLLTPLTQEELTDRCRRFQQSLRKSDLDGAVILQAADLYYLTGSIQTGHLWIPAEGDPVYWAKKSYERARFESPLEHVEQLGSVKDLPGLIREALGSEPKRLGMELDVLPANNFFFYQKLWPQSQILDCAPLLRQVRAVKSNWEIERIRAAAEQLDRAIKKVPGYLQKRPSEMELSIQYETWLREEGHQGLVRMRAFNQEIFFGHVFAGSSSAVPSYFDAATGGPGINPSFPVGAGKKAIIPGEPISFDHVGCVDGYFADQARMFSLGPLDPFFVAAQEKIMVIQQAVIDAAKPGVTSGELYEIAWQKAVALGCEEHLQGEGETQVKFIGHGIGIELDEYPFLARGAKTVLEPNMIFCLEPKLLYRSKGMAGIENTWLVTEKGTERITISPDQVMIV